MSIGWLYRAYGLSNRRWRSTVISLITRLERGQMYSSTLRRIFADYHGVEVGMYSYGCFVPGEIPEGTTIGRYCSFSAGVVIFNANHPLERRSLHPFFYNPTLGVVPRETIERNGLMVGNDVWVGRNAIITPRVRQIGNGAVIGAGAVVTKDVPPYAVVAGNPARILKYRFPKDIQDLVDASRWWERSIEELRDELDDFLKPAVASNLGRLNPRSAGERGFVRENVSSSV